MTVTASRSSRQQNELAYYDNPFEYWAYNNDNNWPPSGADPSLRWA